MRISFVAAVLLASVTYTTQASNAPSDPVHSPGLLATITLFDGTVRTVQLEGVGCSHSICSRTQIKGHADSPKSGSLDVLGRNTIALDAIASIRDTTPNHAVIVLKDGGKQGMHLLTDFRVLYVVNSSGDSERLDLAKVKSVEFGAPAR